MSDDVKIVETEVVGSPVSVDNPTLVNVKKWAIVAGSVLGVLLLLKVVKIALFIAPFALAAGVGYFVWQQLDK
ncbi:MAG: hypothetical protein ACRCXZ_01590 [Patescibacteria group bacterium]